MKPIYSEEDRHKIVMNFITLRGQGRIPIMDFSPLIPYFDDIKPLREIKKTMSYANRYSLYSTGSPSNQPETFFYSSDDAQGYFNWLIWIITVDEKATDEIRKEAVNQLFLFIFALRDKIRVNLDDFLKVRFVWERRVITLKNALKDVKEKVEYNEKCGEAGLADLKDDVEKETEKISSVLERIGNWQKEYQPYLDKLKKEQEGIDKVLRGDVDGKKGKR